MKFEQSSKEEWRQTSGEGADKIVELLDGGIDLPDVTGDFHITIEGVPLCLVDRAWIGHTDSECTFTSLNSSFASRMKLKTIFPAAIVTVLAGKCPAECGTRKVA